MGIKELGFKEIRRCAERFRKIIEKSSSTQDFSIGLIEAEKFLEENSLAPVIGTICDQQIAAEYAWLFPYWLRRELLS